MNYIIVITGATASGKSSFSEQVAQEVGGEIINADIGSFYAPLRIGVAKPDWRHSSIPHHLFDYLSEPRDETVVAYREKVLQLCSEIWERKKVPVIVGGSTLYIKSLFYTQADIPNLDKYGLKEIEQLDNATLWKELLLADPDRAFEIEPSDTYRLQRAISILRATGEKPSSFKVNFNPIAPFYFIEATRDRKILYERINARVQAMMEEGWIEEVQALVGTEWETFLLRKKMMGYDLLLKYLQDDEMTIAKIIARVQKLTRNYAKRQITFYKKLKKQLVGGTQEENRVGFVQECDLTFCDLSLYIKQLSIDLYKNFTCSKN
jgi:tRNA dimethylallyltransferase